MKEVFHIDYPKTEAGRKAWNRQYGMNAYYAGKHWSQRKKDAEYWHWLTVSAMRKAQCRQTPLDKPVVVSILWNDGLDIDNHAVMGKMIVDAMKGVLIHDDTRRYFVGIEHRFHDKEYIEVHVQEVEQ